MGCGPSILCLRESRIRTSPHRHRELVVAELVAEHELGAGVGVLEELLHAISEPLEQSEPERHSQNEYGEQRLEEQAARDDAHIDLNSEHTDKCSHWTLI